MEDRLAVINCIISNPESVAMVNEKLHLQSSMIIAHLDVPCRECGVSVVSIIMHGTQNRISSFTGDPDKVNGVKVKSVQVPVADHQPRTDLQKGKAIEHMEALLSLIVDIAILIFEFIGVDIIIYSGLTGSSKSLRHPLDTRVYPTGGLAMGLESKMGSEIPRTVVVYEWKKIGIVTGIIALCATLTFLIRREIKEEEETEHDSLSLQPQSAQPL